MRSLIAVATLSLALGVSSISFASDHMGLYTTPVAKSDVTQEINGGKVERDHMGFYLSSKEADTDTSIRAEEETNNENTYTVFGVQINRDRG